MRLRNVKNAKDIVANSSYVVKYPFNIKGNYKKEIFHNDNPLHLEIGMGKGNFIIDMAQNNPDINYIGVERYESVVCRALEKLEQLELPNLKIIVIDAKELNNVFDHEISTIYLNFSDPWPKKRHAKRRLTSHVFLKVYDDIFINENEFKIIQKTDNIDLFASSIVSLSQYGYKIDDVSLDLKSEDIDLSLTEYEMKFRDQGVKINYLEASKK